MKNLEALLETNPKLKFNTLAKNFSENSYANCELYMSRRAQIIQDWGAVLGMGDHVFELGAGDGTLGLALMRLGLRYSGSDISDEMIREARNNFSKVFPGKEINLSVVDAQKFVPQEPVDAIVSLMRAFFTYVPDAKHALVNFRPFVKKKIIVDFNPRLISPRSAMSIMKASGFSRVEWRPFLVPSNYTVPEFLQSVLHTLEVIPILRSIPIQWRFHCLLKGEV